MIKNCTVCGGRFSATGTGSVRRAMCSVKCRNENNRRKHRRWYSEHKEYMSEKWARWYAVNKEYRSIYSHKRRQVNLDAERARDRKRSRQETVAVQTMKDIILHGLDAAKAEICGDKLLVNTIRKERPLKKNERTAKYFTRRRAAAKLLKQIVTNGLEALT